MSPATTFERVYRALKEQLGSGGFRPGDPLEPRALSDALNSSITPVRDALHRLVGERLVEAPRASGFRTPLLTEVALRNLYAWNQTLLLAALPGSAAAAAGRADLAATSSEEPIRRLEALFRAIASRSGNPEHVEAVAALGARLRAVRVAETRVLDSIEEELAEIDLQQRSGDTQALRRSIKAYHRRRDRAAAELVAELQSA
jgi:DNA-binding GntR family transcriptional regulator